MIQRICLILLLALIFTFTLKAQTNHSVRVDYNAVTHIPPHGIKPGIFYFHHWLNSQNNVFQYISVPDQYNMMRENKFNSECWKLSLSHSGVLNAMNSSNLQGWLHFLDTYSDDIVIKFNAMPWWLSSSQDLTPINGDNSWYYFNCYPPSDYQAWDSIVRDVVSLIASWGFHPWYEIWNEPDGQYWKGSDQELLELYKHTALAIKETDPQAKVGGFGMHTWWKSADPSLYAQQESYTSPLYGFIHDSIADQFSILYKLMDSVINAWAADSVPLDFISWHYFRFHPEEITYIANTLNQKMLQLGYVHPASASPTGTPMPEHYVSEWQTTYGIQEQAFHGPLFIRFLKKFSEARIRKHTIAAINDFAPDSSDEFTHDWGLMSPNSLLKPVFKSLNLLSLLERKGQFLPVSTSENIDAFASLNNDSLHLLVSHYNMPGVWYSPNYWKVAWNAYNQLLYDTASTYTAPDYISQGYTSVWWGNAPSGSWGNLDLYLMGQANPLLNTPANMYNQMLAARNRWISDSIQQSQMNSLQITLAGNSDSIEATLIRIDSSHNNIIFIYDSLKSAGYSHTSAIDSLRSCTFPGGCFGVFYQSESLFITDSVFTIDIEPNTVMYILFPGIDIITEAECIKIPKGGVYIFPNPADDYISISLPSDEKAQFFLFSSEGDLQMKKQIRHSGQNLNIKSLSPGIYFYRLIQSEEVFSGKLILQ